MIRLDDLAAIAREAGEVILGYYGKPIPTEAKADDSPLTAADRAAHAYIVRELGKRCAGVPVISEESAAEEVAGHADWERFLLVDPLDGTKEFIKQTGYFTVNIALIEKGAPVQGVVYCPVHEILYAASRARAGEVWKQEKDGERRKIAVSPPRTAEQPLRIVASRDHAGPEVAALLARYPHAETRSIGSSLKFCLVAEGEADVYLRDVPTMEWDTGAAQCILETAGGVLRTYPEGGALAYNKADLRNPALVAARDRDLLREIL